MVTINNKENYIERKVKVNNSEVIARYYPKSGGFEFGKKSRYGKIKTPLTGAGALATMGALIEAFKNINPDKICYRAHGNTLREAEIKDKLYERQLKNLGYQKEEIKYNGSDRDLVYSNGFGRERGSNEWNGPNRLWLKHKDKGLEKTLVATSIISLVGIITFLSPILTGNIVGLNNHFSDFIGGLFFIIFLIATLSYFNIKKVI
jgi:hypothetical protein